MLVLTKKIIGMNKVLAFADEYGSNSFDFSKEGTHFVIAAVIIPSENKEIIEEQINQIKKKHNFQLGEIKSSKIGPDVTRRRKVLKDLVELNFSVYAVSIDKKQLEGEGFKYKKSFYKFLNGLIYQELFKTYPNLSLEVDEHGSNRFMLEFKKYVEKNHKPNLFTGSEFNIVNSTKSVLIQVADLIAGTLGHCFDENKTDLDASEFLDILKPKLSGINHFPRRRNDTINQELIENGEYDETIMNLAKNRAYVYLDEKKAIKQEDFDQINFVRLLLLYLNTFGKNGYLSTYEILKHLQVGRKDEIDSEYLRSKVIGKLRDKGLLIASSSQRKKGGYKFPTNEKDLLDFINHGNNLVIPILSRIKRCRESVKLATQNNLDILDSPKFKEIKNILDNQ